MMAMTSITVLANNNSENVTMTVGETRTFRVPCESKWVIIKAKNYYSNDNSVVQIVSIPGNSCNFNPSTTTGLRYSFSVGKFCGVPRLNLLRHSNVRL